VAVLPQPFSTAVGLKVFLWSHVAPASGPSVHRAEIGQARSRSPTPLPGELGRGIEDDSGGQLVARSAGKSLDAAEVVGPDGFRSFELAGDDLAPEGFIEHRMRAATSGDHTLLAPVSLSSTRGSDRNWCAADF
jgi:hypothetical protein